jgi:hypothetical protein
VVKIVGAFEQSTIKYPLIPMGTPDPYDPSRKKEPAPEIIEVPID